MLTLWHQAFKSMQTSIGSCSILFRIVGQISRFTQTDVKPEELRRNSSGCTLLAQIRSSC